VARGRARGRRRWRSGRAVCPAARRSVSACVGSRPAGAVACEERGRARAMTQAALLVCLSERTEETYVRTGLVGLVAMPAVTGHAEVRKHVVVVPALMTRCGRQNAVMACIAGRVVRATLRGRAPRDEARGKEGQEEARASRCRSHGTSRSSNVRSAGHGYIRQWSNPCARSSTARSGARRRSRGDLREVPRRK
jgi:hypothetical protein